jgi:hypothetical protein
MKTLLLAGFLYLLGVAIVLLGKPEFMFQENGDWKEFGIGRDPKKNTWMPVWMFMIFWSVVSYILAILFLKIFMDDGSISENIPVVLKNSKGNGVGKRKSGYYILNNSGDIEDGVPQYIFLGKALPMSDD